VLDVTATRDGGLKIAATGPADKELVVHAPPGTKLQSAQSIKVQLETTP